MRKKFLDSWLFFSVQFTKLHSACLREHLTEKIVILETIFCNILFGLWGNFFQQGCKNCILLVQRNFLMRNINFLKSHIVYHFRTLIKKNFRFDFWQIFFGRVVKTAFCVSRGGFRDEKCSFWQKTKMFLIFGRRAECFWTFAELFSARLSKLHSTCRNEIFLEKNFWKVFVLKVFPRRKFFGLLKKLILWQKNRAQVAKLQITCPKEGDFWAKTKFLKNIYFRNHIRTLSKIFHRVVKNAFYISRWII